MLPRRGAGRSSWVEAVRPKFLDVGVSIFPSRIRREAERRHVLGAAAAGRMERRGAICPGRRQKIRVVEEQRGRPQRLLQLAAVVVPEVQHEHGRRVAFRRPLDVHGPAARRRGVAAAPVGLSRHELCARGDGVY